MLFLDVADVDPNYFVETFKSCDRNYLHAKDHSEVQPFELFAVLHLKSELYRSGGLFSPARKTKPGGIALGSVGGAVEAFCRAVAPELAPQRINIVSPGIIDTPMFGPESSERSTKLDAATAGHVIPRPGTAIEVASAIIFTIQNDFVTGTTVDVDGGWLLS